MPLVVRTSGRTHPFPTHRSHPSRKGPPSDRLGGTSVEASVQDIWFSEFQGSLRSMPQAWGDPVGPEAQGPLL